MKYLIDGYTNGFKLGRNHRPPARKAPRNLRECERNPHIVQELVNKEIRLGHVLGPFDEPPLPNMVFSPLNIVPKQGSKSKYHLIHDLAHPYDNESINSCIPECNSKVKYHMLDEVIEMALELGDTVWGLRMDIEMAFRNQSMHFDELALLGFKLHGKYFINCALPFGASSSCAIFEKVASACQWIVSNETLYYYISHFLDDFPMLATSQEKLLDFMQKFCSIMADIGMPVAHNKTFSPTQVLGYLGLILDFIRKCISIPENKRLKCLQHINQLQEAYTTGKKVTVKQIQQTAGCLNFVCQALPAGRVFLSSLYRLTRFNNGEKRKSGHHRRLSNETWSDLDMFKSFLIQNTTEHFNSIPFLNRLQICNADIQLFADSSGSPALGMGCFFDGEWCQAWWRDTCIFSGNYRPNIALLEVFAIVVAVEIWAPSLSGQSIILRSDNSTTCFFLNNIRADISAAMQLLRHVTRTCLQFQIFLKAEHIEGKLNTESNQLSRGQMADFFKKHPLNRGKKQDMPKTLWPPVWSQPQMEKYQTLSDYLTMTRGSRMIAHSSREEHTSMTSHYCW